MPEFGPDEDHRGDAGRDEKPLPGPWDPPRASDRTDEHIRRHGGGLPHSIEQVLYAVLGEPWMAAVQKERALATVLAYADDHGYSPADTRKLMTAVKAYLEDAAPAEVRADGLTSRNARMPSNVRRLTPRARMRAGIVGMVLAAVLGAGATGTVAVALARRVLDDLNRSPERSPEPPLERSPSPVPTPVVAEVTPTSTEVPPVVPVYRKFQDRRFVRPRLGPRRFSAPRRSVGPYGERLRRDRHYRHLPPRSTLSTSGRLQLAAGR